MGSTATITQIPASSLLVPMALGKLTVTHNGHTFSVIAPNGSPVNIERDQLDATLRGASSTTLAKLLDVGYVSVTQSGKSYTLRFNGRVRGGDPFTAITVYVVTTIVGGVLLVAGKAMAPRAIGDALMGAGVTVITLAPATFIVTLPTIPMLAL